MRAILILSILALGACGKDTAAPTPIGTIRFQRDPVSCDSSADIALTIDGVSRGVHRLAPGQSIGFPAQAGAHVTTARTVPQQYAWADSLIVPGGGIVTTTMSCLVIKPGL